MIRCPKGSKLTQHWCDVVIPPRPDHDTCCCVLDFLQLRQQTVTDALQQAVAVVKAAANERMHQRLGEFQSQRRPDHSQLT